MLLSAVSVLVVAQSSSEIPEGLMNNPVYQNILTMHGPMKVKTTDFVLSLVHQLVDSLEEES